MIIDEPKRTAQQRKSIQLFCRLLADELNGAGLDMRTVLLPGIAIPWSEATVKEQLWRTIQIAMLNIESTTDLNTSQVSQVYDVLNLHLGEKLGVHVPFPHNEEKG